MNAARLAKYGLVPVARVRIADRNFKISITDQEIVKLDKCIYAFLIGGKVVRVGSSKAPLKKRLRDYERDITNALNRKKSPAPPEEAERWEKALPDGISGVIYARRGSIVATPIGEFPAYMDEESLMIRELFDDGKLPHDQIINRNKHR
jgi:hypothetical protein